MSSLPTLIFIPGAWHKPACYTKIMTILESRYGFKCIPITLPSTNGDSKATFKQDIDTARNAITAETVAGRDVVVVSHSYGGMVGNSAIKGFTKHSHIKSPATSPEESSNGNVIGLILIASGFTLTGLSFMDPFFGHPPPQWRINSTTGFAEIIIPPSQFFYHDLPPEEADYWVGQLTPQSLKSLFEGGEHAYSGWRDVPTWYLGTINDQGLPIFAQRMQIGAARAMGASVVHREFRSSHSPFLSLPDEVVGVMKDAVESFTGNMVKSEFDQGKQHIIGEVIVPLVKIWSPLSWLRYGIPYGLGKVIGKLVLIFEWARRTPRS